MDGAMQSQQREGAVMPSQPTAQEQVERYNRRMWELAETDAEVRALIPNNELRQKVRNPDMPYAAIIATMLNGYSGRRAVAERSYDIRPDPETGRAARHYLPAYSAITYDELRARVEGLANTWRHHPHHRVAIDDFIWTIGFTGIDFLVTELAGAYAQAVTVPLQSTLSGTELERILGETRPAIIFATVADLVLAATLAAKHDCVRSVVAIEYDARVDDERAQFEAAKAELERSGKDIRLATISELTDYGRAYKWEPLPPHPLGRERPTTIMHSSGSTGTPKGAIIPERMARLGWIGGIEQSAVPMVAMGFAPKNHFMGRFSVFTALAVGGTTYYTIKPDLSTLFEDIRLANPTFLSFFPRIFDLVHQHYQSEVARRVAAGEGARDAVDAKVRAEMGTGFLGTRLRGGTIGSAPSSPDVQRFMRETFDIMLIEGYGSTEGGIVTSFAYKVLRPPVIDYKLRDVPELGYYTTDKPYPRGELLVKSETQVSGYFKRPDLDKLLFDENGYVCTGDIMEERGPDIIHYIDRRNDVLKLSQAEFVAVGPLGATFEAGSDVIHQIYVYGNSARAYLLAVVVPEMDVVATKIGAHPGEADLKALIRAELQEVARKQNLKSFEVPRDFIIEHEPFSFENGLLSSVRKRMRPNFKRKYGERLEAMYEQIERKRLDELMALKDPASPMTVLQKVVKALEATLGIDGIEADTTNNFRELGGDSIGAASFALFLHDIFGVELPVNAILSPAGNPAKLARLIEEARSTTARTIATAASIHGKDAKVLHAKDLTIERFIDAATLAKVPKEAPPAQSRCVLMTGANGFLGHILCLDWMQRVAKVGGKVICLIRGNDNAAARKRLDAVFEGVDKNLERHYHELAAKHLEVLAGDVADPNLGVGDKEFARLAAEVDRIVHPGALVNHMLSYEHLFGPNVFGTAELIRLALTTRRKRFDFVSSAAVTLHVDTNNGNDEDSPLRASIELGNDYAAGYGATKWADEVLLQDVHRKYALPINIFRGDMMVAHSTYVGQINVPDMFTRLLYSVIMSGLAPYSFYRLERDGSRPKTHYDALPVDFIAGSVAGIGALSQDGIHTYNTLNHHTDDGASLDAIVDWIESAGYKVERVKDHAEWLKRFQAKLSTLTESQRMHSSVMALGAWSTPHEAHPAPIGSAHYIEAVRKIPCGPDVPHITEAFIHKYLGDMRALGLIGAPRVPSR
jgi:fatty acid CoA ligase FadD9